MVIMMNCDCFLYTTGRVQADPAPEDLWFKTGSVTNYLCDGQVRSPPWASVVSSVKWGTSSYLGGLTWGQMRSSESSF